MTTYPADALHKMKVAYLNATCFPAMFSMGDARAEPPSDFVLTQMLAAFDAAMLAHGWKRVPRQATVAMELVAEAVIDRSAADNCYELWAAMYDAAPEVKP